MKEHKLFSLAEESDRIGVQQHSVNEKCIKVKEYLKYRKIPRNASAGENKNGKDNNTKKKKKLS